MNRLTLLVVVLLVAVVMTSCAPGPNSAAVSGTPDVAGFWLGLWHGFIALFTFIISLFNHDVSLYEVNNNGGWYNFGYLLGVMAFWGGGGGGAARGSRSRR